MRSQFQSGDTSPSTLFILANLNSKALVTLKKNLEDPGSNPGQISVYFFYHEIKNSEKKNFAKPCK